MFEDLFGTEISANLIRSLIAVAVVYLAYAIFKNLGSRVLRRVYGKAPDSVARIETLEKVGRRVLQVFVVLLAILVIATVWAVDLGPLLAVSAVFGAAIGFGAQDLVKDLIAGFFILAENQFHIGDVVRIAETEGTVEDIQFRVTVLRDFEGNKHFVPNGQITVSSNLTAVFAQPVLDIGVAYKTDIDMAMDVMLDELTKMAHEPAWSDYLDGDPEVMGVQQLADSAVVLRARFLVVADQRWNLLREARRRIKNRFDAEGIEIPFPHRTVFQSEG
jgi:moderate conductance mechanosensitive channel